MKKLLSLIVLVVVVVVGWSWYQEYGTGQGSTTGLQTFVDREIPPEHQARLTADIARMRAEIGDRIGENKSMEDLDRWINIANLQYVLGQLSAARETLLETVDLNAVNYVAWGNLGDVLTEMQDREGARAAYQKAVEYSNTGQYILKYADFLRDYASDEPEEYERVLKNAVEVRGQRAEFISRLANFYMEEENYEEAVTHYEVLLGLVPEDTNIQRDLAKARKKLAESRVEEE
jgi:tetratricopeptide (TPR) repeat protein